MKKILFISHSPHMVAGAEKSLFELVMRLDKTHYHCHVFLPDNGGFAEALKENDIACTVIPFSWSMRPPESAGLVNISDEANFNARSLVDFKTEIENIAPDAVVTNTIVVPWAMYICRALNIPNIFVASEWFMQDGLSDFLPEPEEYIRRIFLNSDWVLFNSAYTKKDMRPMRGTKTPEFFCQRQDLIVKISMQHIERMNWAMACPLLCRVGLGPIKTSWNSWKL